MKPERSIAPLFWLLFGAGGMLAALFGPGLIIVTGLLAPQGLGFRADYARVLALVQNPIGKVVLLGFIALFFWHAAERIFLTLKDMRAGSVLALRLATYGLAAVMSLVTIALLIAIGF